MVPQKYIIEALYSNFLQHLNEPLIFFGETILQICMQKNIIVECLPYNLISDHFIEDYPKKRLHIRATHSFILR